MSFPERRGDGGDGRPGGRRGPATGTPRVTAEHGPDALWLACSHGDVIKAIVADALGLHLDLFQRIVADPASVTVIRYTPTRPFLLRLNDTGATCRRWSRRSAARRRRARPPTSDAAVGGGAGSGGDAAGVRLRLANRPVRAHAARADRVVGMTHQVYAFEPPERFVAGTVGRRGSGRSSCRPAAAAGWSAWRWRRSRCRCSPRSSRSCSPRRTAGSASSCPRPADRATDNEPLDTPLDEEFRVGTLGLAFDVDTATVVIEAIAAGEGEAEAEAEDDEDRATRTTSRTTTCDRLRVRLTPQATRAFIDRAQRVVAAGRPPCPLCGQPLDPRRAPLPAAQRLPPVTVPSPLPCRRRRRAASC